MHRQRWRARRVRRRGGGGRARTCALKTVLTVLRIQSALGTRPLPIAHTRIHHRPRAHARAHPHAGYFASALPSSAAASSSRTARGGSASTPTALRNAQPRLSAPSAQPFAHAACNARGMRCPQHEPIVVHCVIAPRRALHGACVCACGRTRYHFTAAEGSTGAPTPVSKLMPTLHIAGACPASAARATSRKATCRARPHTRDCD